MTSFVPACSLVEIDLLRAGDADACQLIPPPQTDYRIIICRAGRSKSAELYSFSWMTPIPAIPIPLLPGDAEPTLDLNAVLHALIERGRYDLVIDYRQPPQPPLQSGRCGLGRRNHCQGSRPNS